MRHQRTANALSFSGIKPNLKAANPHKATAIEKSAQSWFILFFVFFEKTKNPKNRLDIKISNPEKANGFIVFL